MSKRTSSNDSILHPPDARIRLSADEAERTSAGDLEESAPQATHDESDLEEGSSLNPEAAGLQPDGMERTSPDGMMEQSSQGAQILPPPPPPPPPPTVKEEFRTPGEKPTAVVRHLNDGLMTSRSVWRKAAGLLTSVMEILYLTEHDARHYIIVDSNLFLHYLDELETVRTQIKAMIGKEKEVILIVPHTVYAELERMKKSLRIPKDLQKSGEAALVRIGEMTEAGIAIGQDSQEAEKSYKDWFRYPIVTNDDRILHCALHFKYRYGKPNVGVLSQDRGMRVNARSMKIVTFHIQEPEKVKGLKRLRGPYLGKGPEPAKQTKSSAAGEVSSTQPTQKPVASICPKSDVEKCFLLALNHIMNLRQSMQIALALEINKTTRDVAMQSLKLLLRYVDAIDDLYTRALSEANMVESDACDALQSTFSLFLDQYNIKDAYITRRGLDRFFTDGSQRTSAEDVMAMIVTERSSFEEARKLITYLESL